MCIINMRRKICVIFSFQISHETCDENNNNLKPYREFSKRNNWINLMLSFFKYILVIVIFNYCLFTYVKYKLRESNLELSLRETVPQFY